MKKFKVFLFFYPCLRIKTEENAEQSIPSILKDNDSKIVMETNSIINDQMKSKDYKIQKILNCGNDEDPSEEEEERKEILDKKNGNVLSQKKKLSNRNKKAKMYNNQSDDEDS